MADINQIKLPDGDTYNIKDNTKLPLAGGTMSGQIKTSFKSSVATGSYGASASTIPDLCTELRYSSGVMGSASISTAYTKNGVTIAKGWYNFLWIPHRSGGVNGKASGDNCDYGSLYLSGMTTSGCYMLRFASGNIAELKDLYKDTTYESKPAASGGTALSLVTTGEKYNWNNKTAETYSLILLNTLTNTETTFTTYNSRKFSDYDLYIFTFGTSDINIRRTVVLTKSQWKDGSSIDEGILHGASSSTVSSYDYCGIFVKYGSDTSIKAKVFGSGDINKFSVLGIKY